MNGQISDIQTRAREAASQLLLTHADDDPPHQQVASSSYVIKVAAPHSIHEPLASVLACRSESVIHSMPLTLLLSPKQGLKK